MADIWASVPGSIASLGAKGVMPLCPDHNPHIVPDDYASEFGLIRIGCDSCNFGAIMSMKTWLECQEPWEN